MTLKIDWKDLINIPEFMSARGVLLLLAALVNCLTHLVAAVLKVGEKNSHSTNMHEY